MFCSLNVLKYFGDLVPTWQRMKSEGFIIIHYSQSLTDTISKFQIAHIQPTQLLIVTFTVSHIEDYQVMKYQSLEQAKPLHLPFKSFLL